MGLVLDRGVTTFPSGDLLFAELSSLTFCVDFATGAFTGSGALTYIGGTGQLAGATGSADLTNIIGNVLVADPAGRVFNWASGESSGTIVLP